MSQYPLKHSMHAYICAYVFTHISIVQCMWSNAEYILIYLDTIQPIYSHSEAYADRIHTVISSQ